MSILNRINFQLSPTLSSTLILIARLAMGIGLMIHGFSKIQNPFAWMGPDAAVPGFFQALAALSEFGGGFAWILGLLTPLASLGVLSTMAVAIYTHAAVRGDPYVGMGGPSYEPATMYFCFALVMLAVGPRRFSLDHCLKSK